MPETDIDNWTDLKSAIETSSGVNTITDTNVIYPTNVVTQGVDGQEFNASAGKSPIIDFSQFRNTTHRDNIFTGANAISCDTGSSTWKGLTIRNWNRQGDVFRLHEDGTQTFRFEDCTFENCGVRKWWAVQGADVEPVTQLQVPTGNIIGSAWIPNGTLEVINCTFTNCTTQDFTHAHVMYVWCGTATITDCTFTNCGHIATATGIVGMTAGEFTRSRTWTNCTFESYQPVWKNKQTGSGGPEYRLCYGPMIGSENNTFTNCTWKGLWHWALYVFTDASPATGDAYLAQDVLTACDFASVDFTEAYVARSHMFVLNSVLGNGGDDYFTDYTGTPAWDTHKGSLDIYKDNGIYDGNNYTDVQTRARILRPPR